MRRTLRRSCAACAKAKHSCDLQTPKCTRCKDRNSTCVYANQPLTSARISDNSPGARNSQLVSNVSPQLEYQVSRRALSEPSGISMTLDAHSVDPFDTYPQTSLPRARVQGLIHHFLSKIVYQYYPWDTNPASNPFVTSWWHLALSDPALFHVSLQTASLDDELHAQKGFVHSEILMGDSVSLVRKKIQDPSQAFQDETLNAVVTLAAIEHGKGNLPLSKVHIEGVKRMVQVRGGISEIKLTNPLTARMVSWVSMLVMGCPQFEAQDGTTQINGVGSILVWDVASPQATHNPSILCIGTLEIDPMVLNILQRLQAVFEQQISAEISVADRQDLACFVIHKLLRLPSPSQSGTGSAEVSEAIRYAICVYMFLIHGPTYYSHMTMLKDLVLKLQHYLTSIPSFTGLPDSLHIWLFSVGMVASIGTEENEWFVNQCSAIASHMGLHSWGKVDKLLTEVLWLEGMSANIFHQAWEQILTRKRILGRGG